MPQQRRETNARKCISVKGARGNNLKNVNAEIPLGTFTCVTGVSGGGKSTLLIDTLYKSLARKLNNARGTPAEHDTIDGLHLLDKVIDIDQSPIGRTRAPIRRPIPAHSRRYANGLPDCRKRKRADISRVVFFQRQRRTL